MPSRNRLIEEPVGKTLLLLTLPMIVGIVGMMAFNLVDTYFVGRLGTAELAAMSFTFPIVLIVSSVARGLSVGTSAVIARAIGEGDREKIRRLTTDSLILSFLVVLMFAIVGVLTIDPLFRLLGADEQMLPLIRRYMRIWYPGVAFVVIPMVGNGAIRATGDTKTPSIIMLIAIAVNLTFDPLLIFGVGPFPRLELEGAAIATVMARATTFVVSLLILGKREKMLTSRLPSIRELMRSWKKVLYIGLPSAGTLIIIPFATGIITRMVAAYGPASVAGFGVASRIEGFALAVVSALGTVLVPFIGQNIGAGKIPRVKSALHFSQIFAIIWGAITFALMLIFATPVARIFNDNPDVIDTASRYLVLVSISYGAFGLFQLVTAAFNAMNRPVNAAVISLMRVFALYVPLAALGKRLFDLTGVFAAATAANILSAFLAFVWISATLRSMTHVRRPDHEDTR